DAPDLSAIPASAYSPGLERIVARALAKPREERYQNLEQMRDELEGLVRETARRLATTSAPSASEVADLEAAIASARTGGQLQKALTLCRRLLEKDPDHAGAQQARTEVEGEIRDKEVEQLVTMALGYADAGDLDLAAQIAARVGALAPTSPRYLELSAYIADQKSRGATEALVAVAQDRIVAGDVEGARAAAEAVLASRPDHVLAREIRDRAAAVLDRRARATPPPVEAPPAEPVPPSPVLPPPSPMRPAATPGPESRRAEAAALATAALDAFLRNDHGLARRTVEKALSLDPANGRARELREVLGVLE
ncbi:MAG TPA: hypothetical protein VGQ33_14845, partial [Vicinamibacteria bacterium]|nr:hypothetical protein [Vicinamibacteria bacterium]